MCLYRLHTQHCASEIEHRMIGFEWCMYCTRVSTRCDVLVWFTSVAIFRTQFWGLERFETHIGGKLRSSDRTTPLQYFCPQEILTPQGNCTTACNRDTFLHTCPTRQPCHFGRPQPSCVLAAHPAHSTLVWSSLLLLQLLVTYALARRKASPGMQRTCSDLSSHSLEPI